MRRGLVFSLAAASLLLPACTAEDATPNTGLTLPAPQEPDTLLPSINVTDPPDITQTLPADAMFGGNICGALTSSDLSRVFNGARTFDIGLLSLDTCRYLVGSAATPIDVRVGLSSIAEFTSPQQEDVSAVGATLPPTPATEKITTDDIPDTAEPSSAPSTTPSGSEVTTTEVVAQAPPEVEELSGVGLGIRGLRQGPYYEVYVKVTNGFFTVLAPTKADAIELAKLVVPRAKR